MYLHPAQQFKKREREKERVTGGGNKICAEKEMQGKGFPESHNTPVLSTHFPPSLLSFASLFNVQLLEERRSFSVVTILKVSLTDLSRKEP
jgi:hypothetical protein